MRQLSRASRVISLEYLAMEPMVKSPIIYFIPHFSIKESTFALEGKVQFG